MESTDRTVSRDDVVAAIAAFPIGIVAGVTGVGGGEYRAPVLLLLLKNVRWTIAANLFAGTVFATSLVILRGALFQPIDTLFLAAVMIIASMPGAYAGALLARRTPARGLKGLLAGILFATALRLLLFPSETPGTFAFGPTQVALGVLTGFGIGAISGLLGVAGGEYRIPALILIFGLPAIAAGTISSLVSLPQQVVAFLKHRQLGQSIQKGLRLALIMGGVGVFGIVLGVELLRRTNDTTVTRSRRAVSAGSPAERRSVRAAPVARIEPGERICCRATSGIARGCRSSTARNARAIARNSLSQVRRPTRSAPSSLNSSSTTASRSSVLLGT